MHLHPRGSILLSYECIQLGCYLNSIYHYLDIVHAVGPVASIKSDQEIQGSFTPVVSTWLGEEHRTN
jgi:hypothetical protein